MPLAMQKQYQQGPQGPNFLKRATRSASSFMNGLLQNNSAKPLPISRTTSPKGLVEITTSEQYIKVVMDREKDVFLEYSAEWVLIFPSSNLIFIQSIPAQTIAEKLTELAQKYYRSNDKITIARVDIEKVPIPPR